MIIQCSQCSAKFRFDDAFMRQEGVWVRCGLCQYEFFQGSPFAPPVAPRVETPAGERKLMDRGAERPDMRPEEGIDEEPVIKDDAEDMEEMVETSKKSPARGRRKMLAYALALLLVLAGAGWLAFPDLAQQTISEWSAYLPWIDQEPQRPSVGDGIRIEAVRQRFVANMFAGNLRVVEGTVVNETGQSLRRLQLKATLVDAQGNGLGEKRAYAGQVLSDAELTALNEEEMNRRLAAPEEGTAPKERILAGGRIPFMIVWAAEPPGAAKTFVAVAAVERLPQ